jgi:S1-C subfamily serine protease
MFKARLLLLCMVLALVAGLAAADGMPRIFVYNSVPAATMQRVSFMPQPAFQAAPTATPPPSTELVNDPLRAGPAAAVAPAPVTIVIQPGADDESRILQAVYQKANPAVVQVVNLAESSGRFGTSLGMLPQGQGSGFLWDNQGHIITNDHVVDGADTLQVVFADGTDADAKLVGTDPGGDIAVIQVDPALVTHLVPAEQGDMSGVQVGDMVVAIGNPYGFQNTMTRGIVSALGRSIPSQTQYSIPEAIQTDAAMNPGNSGGPLLNSLGQVVGVNDQIESRSGSSSGVGFAIPIDLIQRIVPALIKDGKYEHAYLGITADTFSRTWAQALNLPTASKGIYIMDAPSDGPAAQVGLHGGSQDTSIVLNAIHRRPSYLQSGGDLLTAINGQPLVKMDDLLMFLEQQGRPGQTVQLTFQRNGNTQTVTVTLGVRPDQSTSINQIGNGIPQA